MQPSKQDLLGEKKKKKNYLFFTTKFWKHPIFTQLSLKRTKRRVEVEPGAM